jgi:hypothetical protein
LAGCADTDLDFVSPHSQAMTRWPA